MMRHEITTSQLNTLMSLKGKVMLVKDRFCLIQNYSVEKIIETPKRTWFNRNPKSKEKIYLTDLVIVGYNENEKYFGTFDEEFCSYMIACQDLYVFAKKWENLLEALDRAGYNLVPKSSKQ